MTRWLLSILVALTFAFAGSAALAEMNVEATIDKTKSITVIETLDIEKNLDLDVGVRLAIDKGAESEAIFNQRNQGNKACGNCAEKADIIENGSITGNNGVVTVNQSAGNMNNQGAALSIAGSFGGGEESFSNSQAAMTQIMGVLPEDTVEGETANVIESRNLLFRDAIIEGSINDNTGVVAVNQTPSNINNQAIGLSVGVSLTNGIALSEADLGQFNTENSMDELGVLKSANIGTNPVDGGSGAILRNRGFTAVNQAAGNFANQAINGSFAFSSAGVALNGD